MTEKETEPGFRVGIWELTFVTRCILRTVQSLITSVPRHCHYNYRYYIRFKSQTVRLLRTT